MRDRGCPGPQGTAHSLRLAHVAQIIKHGTAFGLGPTWPRTTRPLPAQPRTAGPYGVIATDTCTGGIRWRQCARGAASRTSGPVLERSAAGVPNVLCPIGRIVARTVHVLSSIQAATKVPAAVVTRLGLVA